MVSTMTKQKAIKETFTGYDMDLLALWLSGATWPSVDKDLTRMLASLDAERHLLYREIRDKLHPKGK